MYCPHSGFLLIENVEPHHAGTCVSLDFLFEKILFDKQHICVVSFQCGSACDTVECSSVKTSCGIWNIYAVSLLCGSACDGFKWFFNVNLFWHSVHSCGFSPVWVSMCCCRLYRRLNSFLQYLHWCVIDVRLRFCTWLVALIFCLSSRLNDLSSWFCSLKVS